MSEHPSARDVGEFAAGKLPRRERARQEGLGALPGQSESMVMLASLLSGQFTWRQLSAAEISALDGVPKVRALLQAGFSLRHQEPETMLRLAKLARCAADRLGAGDAAPAAIADLRSMAYGELANAYRVNDDLAKAAAAMNGAIHWFRRGSCAPLLVARMADLMASLLAAQRRLGEADELLAMACEVYTREGLAHLAGRALIKAGYIASLNGAHGRAIQRMSHGLNLLDPQRDPQLVQQALRGMISFLCELGQYRTARRLLWRSRHFFTENADDLDLLRLRWVEGRIFAGLSDHVRAERAFAETRSGFAAKGQIYPAALAALDLAALWARQGRIAEVHQLAEEVLATFRALRVAREAIAALVLLKSLCKARGAGQVLEVIQLVVSFLEELERQPAHRQSEDRRPERTAVG